MKILFRTWCIFVMGVLLAINAVVTGATGTELSEGDFREEADDAGVLNMTFPSELSLVSEHELISLNFQNTDIRTVLQAAIESSELNIVISDTVKGDISLRLHDVSWIEVLDIIMQARGLSANWDGHVLCIGPRGGVCQEQRERTEQQRETREVVEPLRTQVFQLNGISSFAVMEMLSVTNALSERGSAIIDISTNKVIVTDILERRDYVAALLAQIYVPRQQVMIDVRIVEAQYGWGRHLRARMMQQYWQSKAEDTNQQAMSGAETVALDGSWAGGHVINMRNKEHIMAQFNLPHTLGVMNTDIYAYQFNSEFSNWLQQELSELNERQFGRDIASPRLLAMSSVPARVEQGVQIPYCGETSCNSAISTGNRHDALIIQTTSYITEDQRIILNVSIEGEYFNAAEIRNLANRVIAYGVSMDNGGTLIIGGLSRSDDVKTVIMPKWLMDIPIIGRYNQPSSSSEDYTELILFITPRVVDDNLINQVRQR